MGIRIDIKWEFVSPLLQTASGVVLIEEHYHDLTGSPITKKILKFRCHIEKNSSGFSGMQEGEGVTSETFNLFEAEIRSMMKHYFDGMLLRDKMYHWIEDSLTGSGTFEE